MVDKTSYSNTAKCGVKHLTLTLLNVVGKTSYSNTAKCGR